MLSAGGGVAICMHSKALDNSKLRAPELPDNCKKSDMRWSGQLPCSWEQLHFFLAMRATCV